MEDRKRPLNYAIESGPPQKKTVPDDDQDGSPISQNDLEQFQKEAIFRRMQSYKRECSLYQSQIHNLSSKLKNHDDQIRNFTIWIDQFIDECRIALGKDLPEISHNEIIPSYLLSSDGETFFDFFDKKKGNALQIIKNVIYHANNNSDVSLNDYKTNLATLSAQIKKLQAKSESLQTENSLLQENLSNTKEKYLDSENKLDRLKSPSVAKLESRTIIHNNDNTQNNSNNDTQPNGTTSVSTSSEETQLALKQLEQVCKNQNQTIEDLENKVTTFKQRCTDLTYRIDNLSDDDITKSTLYKSILSKYESLSTNLKETEAKCESLENELIEIKANQQSFREGLLTEFGDFNDSLQNQLSQSEQDLVRIRSARDDLLQELSIRKAKDEQKIFSTNEIKELAETRLKRIQSLEMEIKRLKIPTSSDDSSPDSSSTDYDSKSLDELKKIAQNLSRENKCLISELPGLEEAFNQAHAQASKKFALLAEKEDKINKLSIEKAKADQKYFSAMRAKEAIAAENKSLKTQTYKSVEVVQQLKLTEKDLSEKIETLNQLVATKEKNDTKYKKEKVLYEQQVKDLLHSINNLKKLNAHLEESMKNLNGVYKQEQSGKKNLEEKITKLEVEIDFRKKYSHKTPVNKDSAEFEALRSIAICSVCSRNFKDTALKVCGHAFCYDCAKDRLNARLRKCPICNKQYSFNDLMSLHL